MNTLTPMTLVTGLVMLAAARAHAEPIATSPATPPPASQPAALPRAQHVPIHDASSSEVQLQFSVREPDRLGTIIVRCMPRARGAAVHEVQARRGAEIYLARVPAACAQPPGFSYFAVLSGPDGELPLFASAAAPHRVRVTHPPLRERELAQLRAHGFQRSHALLGAELVSFGERAAAPGAAAMQDRYYRVEIGYAYAFFGTIEQIGLSVVRVRGQDVARAPLEGATAPLEPGIDYGRAAVTVRASEVVRLRSALLLGASQEGFEWGGGGEIIIGDPRAEHVMLGAEALTTLGMTAYLRLGFNAISTVPMAARVELTDFPLGSDAALRLLYEIGYRFTPATELTLRGGYQGRAALGGGPSLGAALRYGF